MTSDDYTLTRRRTLAALVAAGGAGLAATDPAPAQTAPALLPGANVCILTPQQVEGPFYFDPKLERVDITEGKIGVPLGLLLQVVEAGNCAPVKRARVDVWHADAVGAYSGYAGQTDARNVSTVGQHFLRGTQFTDDLGQVRFSTIYPGWYQGRTAHIHLKVILDDRTVLTTQLYFPDALSEYIYANVKPYNTRGRERDTLNATDGVLRESGGGHASFCSIKEEADRYLAALVIGVDRAARPVAAAPPGPPPGPPPGGARPEGPPRTTSRAGKSLVPGVTSQ